jgi:hypothetical protein
MSDRLLDEIGNKNIRSRHLGKNEGHYPEDSFLSAIPPALEMKE